jgi:hypothetical protein
VVVVVLLDDDDDEEGLYLELVVGNENNLIEG